MCLWSILLAVVLLNSSSVQQPTFFRNVFKGLVGVTQRTRLPVKNEITAVYYYEQTIAVVEIGANNELSNCNLIEV